MTTEQDNSYRSGMLAGRVEALENRLTRNEQFVGTKLSEVDATLGKVLEKLNQQVGASRSTILVLTLGSSLLAGAISGVITKLIH